MPVSTSATSERSPVSAASQVSASHDNEGNSAQVATNSASSADNFTQ